MTDRVSTSSASLLPKTAVASKPQAAPSKPQASPKAASLEGDRADVSIPALYNAPPGSGDLLARAIAAEKKIKEENSKQQKALQDSATRGAMIGGVMGSAIHVGITSFSSVKKEISAEPLGLVGKSMIVLGVGISSYELGADGMRIAKDVGAKTVNYRSIGVHCLDLVGNGLIVGGLVASVSGVGTLPALLVIGAGNVLTISAQYMEH